MLRFYEKNRGKYLVCARTNITLHQKTEIKETKEDEKDKLEIAMFSEILLM